MRCSCKFHVPAHGRDYFRPPVVMAAPPLEISVIIPVYNAAKFVEAAVRSALQFEEVKEVVLVDDAGPDDSLAICEGLAAQEPRVKLFRHPGGVNKGAAASRNLGMERSSHAWIAFLDADDIFLPNRFDAEKEVLRQHPDADGVYGAIGSYFHDQEGKERFEQVFKDTITTVRKRLPPEQVFSGLTGGIPDFGHFHLNALTVRRAALERLTPWMRPEINLHEDTDFCIRLAWQARLYPGSIDEPVALRGVHEANRITASQRYSPLKLVLYRELWLWSVRAGCPHRACSYFLFKYRLSQMAMAKGPFQVLASAWRGKRFIGRYDFRDLLFRRMGMGKRTAGLLHTLGRRREHAPNR